MPQLKCDHPVGALQEGTRNSKREIRAWIWHRMDRKLLGGGRHKAMTFSGQAFVIHNQVVNIFIKEGPAAIQQHTTIAIGSYDAFRMRNHNDLAF